MSHTVIPTCHGNHCVQFNATSPDGVSMSRGSLIFRDACFAGRMLLCGTVGGVGTDPEYRRGGLVREIFAEMAKECARRSVPLTILHPFSFSYYRSFGFERVGDHRVLEFPITALNFVPRYPDLIRCQGTERNQDLAHVYNTFAAEGRHLMFRRWAESFPTGSDTKRFYISYDEAGKPDGYLALEIENYFSVNRMVSVNLHVHEIIGLTSDALRKLFGFLRMFEGEMETVKIHNVAMIPEVELLLRHYMHTSITVLPDLMARINDVKAFFEAVPYPLEAGCFTFKTEEPPKSPWSGESTSGVWQVTYENGAGVATRLPDGADYDFFADIPALTQLVFGYDSYGYDTARFTESTVWNHPAPDFFRAFPRRPGGIFEHF